MSPEGLDAALAWILAHPVVSHSLVGLLAMAAICPVLQLLRLRFFAWHAAAYVSVFFYAREAAQAEKAWKPLVGDPAAFFLTLWPGAWTIGGARLSEWLAPTLCACLAAALTPRDPFIQTWPARLRRALTGR